MWAIVQTLILSVIWFIGLMMILIPVMLVLTVLTMLSPALASGAVFVMLTPVFLVDRAVVLYPTRDLCAQAECFLFDLHQFADGTLHTPNERFVRAHVCFFFRLV